MADIVNLRQFRKAKQQATNEARAAENRLLHGRTKAERQTLEAEREAKARRVEAHRLLPVETGPGKPDPS